MANVWAASLCCRYQSPNFVPMVSISDICLENGGQAFHWKTLKAPSVKGAGVLFLFQSWLSFSISVFPVDRRASNWCRAPFQSKCKKKLDRKAEKLDQKAEKIDDKVKLV